MVYFIATPIGNLAEITLRALEVMKTVDCIFCEDTRHSLKLLNHYNIQKPLYAFHKFNEIIATKKIIALVKQGKSIAILSDAGMPAICDPGYILTQKLKEEEIQYTVLSGACAFVNALVLSGLSTTPFIFFGFLTGNKKNKVQLLQAYKNLTATLIFYAAPHDIDNDIQFLLDVLGNRKAYAVREISKVYESVEEFYLIDGLPSQKKGEYVLLVEGNREPINSYGHLSPLEHINYYITRGYDKKMALKKVAEDRGVSKNSLYKLTIQDKDNA